jgi:hypothetical protein
MFKLILACEGVMWFDLVAGGAVRTLDTFKFLDKQNFYTG